MCDKYNTGEWSFIKNRAYFLLPYLKKGIIVGTVPWHIYEISVR